MTQAAIRERAHNLLDSLPPEHLTAVVGVLEVLVPAQSQKEPDVRWEDEPISDDENKQAIAAQGPWTSMEEVMPELGFTQADLDSLNEEDRVKADVR
jgi:hypothetical protein